MVSDGTNFSEFVPSKADGVRDYNDSGRNIRVGFAGGSLGLGNSDAEQNVKYLAGYTESGTHIKDVNQNVVRQYLGINNIDNTADANKSVNYANSAGSANKCNNVIYSHQNEINFSIAAYDSTNGHLKTINKSMFAKSSHSHSEYAANDVVTVSSTQPTSSTCKLWIKI